MVHLMCQNADITQKEGVPVNPMTLILATIGVGYAAIQLTRFLVWLDAADKADT